MYCESYNPGDYFPRDVIPGATAISWPQLNNEIPMRSGTCYNILIQQSPVNQYMGYVKEVMRQALLKHEAIFRQQVHELHRLYGRQKELMNEVQRTYTHLEISSLNPKQPDISQEPVHACDLPSVNGGVCHPLLSSPERFHGPFGTMQNEPVYINPSTNKENGQEELGVLPSITNKFGKRMFDLELPPDQYCDSEKEEDNTEVPHVQCHPPKETSGFECDLKNSSLPHIDSCSLNSTSGRPTCLIDLNEPFQLDESEFLVSTSHEKSVRAEVETNCMDLDRSQKLTKESEVLDDREDCTIRVEKDTEACCNTIHRQANQVELLPHHLEGGLGGATSSSFMRVSSTERTMPGSKFTEEGHDMLGEGHTEVVGTCISSSQELVPCSAESKPFCSSSFGRKLMQDSRKKIVQALPCFHKPNLLESEKSIKNKGKLDMKRNFSSNPSSGNVSSHPFVSSDNDPNAEIVFSGSNASDDPRKVEDIEKNEKGEKLFSLTACDSTSISVDCSKGDLALHSGMGNLSTCKTPFHLKTSRIENKPSPAKSEGDLEAPVSPENKECTPPRGESEDLQLEESSLLIREDCPEVEEELDKIAAETMISFLSSKFHCGCLAWFAGVVSSAAEDENDIEKLISNASVAHHKGLRFESNDCFEKLKDTEAKDVGYRTNDGNNEQTAKNLLPTKKGREKRNRQQRVLKKKALSTLGELRRVTGSALDTSTKRKRNSVENDFAKRRQHFNRIHCGVLDKGRFLGKWGLDKGQRRPRRARTGFDDFSPLADLRRLYRNRSD